MRWFTGLVCGVVVLMLVCVYSYGEHINELKAEKAALIKANAELKEYLRISRWELERCNVDLKNK